MARDSEFRQNKIYYIPDNFIDEGRFNAGMISVRTRYLAEAIIYGLVFVLLSLFIPVKSFNNRLTVSIIIAGPAFGVGLSGINGEPVSTTISHVWNWYKQRQIMLYDTTPLVLTESPIDKMMSMNNKSSALALRLEDRKRRRVEEREHRLFVLGENFEFAKDRDYTRKYITLEDLIKREIDNRMREEQKARESLSEIELEDDFEGPLFDDDNMDSGTITISGDNPEDSDALAAINYDDTPTIFLQTSDSDDILFDFPIEEE